MALLAGCWVAAKITGRDRLRFAITKLPKEVRKELRATILTDAESIADMQRRLAPHEHLKRGIKVTPADRDVALYNKLRSRRTVKDPELAAIIHIGEMDAAWTEFGTPPHTNLGRFPGTHHPGTPPRPYFFPGFRAMKKRVQARINKAVRKALRNGFK